MGFTMKLAKENNHLYADFDNAYWSIDNVEFSTHITYEGDVKTSTPIVSFSLRAYASRDAKIKEGKGFSSTLSFGGANALAYNPCLYEWKGIFETSLIFTSDIPTSEAEQKDVLYTFVKEYLQLTDYTDVIEYLGGN